MQPCNRVAGDDRRVGTPGWEQRRSAEIERPARDADLRQTDRLRDANADSKIGRIELCGWRIRSRKPIEPDAGFIHSTFPKNVRLTE